VPAVSSTSFSFGAGAGSSSGASTTSAAAPAFGFGLMTHQPLVEWIIKILTRFVFKHTSTPTKTTLFFYDLCEHLFGLHKLEP
jgi:hypothetical protein